MPTTFASEQMARIYYLWMLLIYTGIREKSTWHLELLALYNRIEPLPRQHKAVPADSWCAIFLNGIAWAMGFRSWPWECSCTRIMQEAKRRGIWREGWTVMPKLGDWIIYDWGNNGTMDHIGAVCAIAGNQIWVVEGNYDNGVKIRRITVGDGYVEGSVALDFGELVEMPVERVDVLRPGDKGETVRKLQFTLHAAGYYHGILDGEYGQRTTEAVELFQYTNGLDPDGLAGPITQGRLRACDYAIITEVGQMPEKRYQRIEEVPEWGRATIEKMVAKQILQGDGAGLDLSLDMIRVFVTNDRAGLYDS